jgi:Putative beta-barrel porin-2, OmpL-like. bbp2
VNAVNTLLFSICCMCFARNVYAQQDSLPKFDFSGYAELYYSYEFSYPANSEKPDYSYNHKKHNQPALNLAFVKANYKSDRFRSNLALMVGNYATYNLSGEPQWAKPLMEANLGMRLLTQKQLWLDAGVMPSHIGFESAVGSDCWNLTRSILAENSPYYESGIKLNYTSEKENLYLALLVLNGWQRIGLANRNAKPSMGVQVNYKPNDALTLNYSNFIGNIQSNSMEALRIFHNAFAIYEPSTNWSFIMGFDIGTQKDIDKHVKVWYSPVIITKFKVKQKSKIAARFEYYRDAKQVIIQTETPNGYQTFGSSLNYDYQISPKVLCRAELKQYNSKDAIFRYNQNRKNQTTGTIALIVKL